MKTNTWIKSYFVTQNYNGLPGIGIASCGHWKIYDHILKNRTRKDFLFIYCTGGSGCYISGEKQYDIMPGQIFMAFPGIPHSYWCNNEGWEIWFVHFGGDQASRLASWAGFDVFTPVMDIGIQNELITILEQMFVVAEEKKLNYEIKAAGFLYQLLTQIKTYTTSKQVHNAGVQASLLGKPDNVEEMAKSAGMSKYHFIREFKKAVGITPWQFIIQKKITHAKELLCDKSLSIKQIAYNLDFKDANYFSRLFKKEVGTSAKQFRDSISM